MSRMFKALAALVALAYMVAVAGAAGVAILALFGFAFPILDLLNHAQPILFAACLLALLCAPVLVPAGSVRALALALSATGLTASGFVYLPEALSRYTTAHAEYGAAPVYTLMTFNVFALNARPEEIVRTVQSVDPDIVALQEYNLSVRGTIHAALQADYPHFQYCVGGVRAFVGLYSKIPFEPLEDGTCSGSIMNTDRTARIIAAFLPAEGRGFTVATTHHDWPAPIWRQREQLDTLAGVLGGIDPPLILTADFNSTPWSYALRDFTAQAGLVRHTRNLPTFPTLWHYWRDWRPALPFLPIDHVMTRGGVAVHGVETGPASGSDHLPVIVQFSVPEQPALLAGEPDAAAQALAPPG